MCDAHPKMMSSMPLLVLALTTAFAAPAAIYDDYVEQVPQKRAALVLDRLLVALQKALHEDGSSSYERQDRDGPRTAPLRIADDEISDMVRHQPQKRAALVLGQLLIALQKALQEGGSKQRYPSMDDVPRAAPVRIDEDVDYKSSLERRGQPNPGRGRVLRCYFNAVTCF